MHELPAQAEERSDAALVKSSPSHWSDDLMKVALEEAEAGFMTPPSREYPTAQGNSVLVTPRFAVREARFKNGEWKDTPN